MTEIGELIRLGSAHVRLVGHLEAIAVDGGVRPVRLPTRYWQQFPPGAVLQHFLRTPISAASGVRLLVRTSATTLRLRTRCTQLEVAGFRPPANSFVASIDGDDVVVVPTPVDVLDVVSFTGPSAERQLTSSSIVVFADLPSHDKVVEIWLPQGVSVDLLDIEADAPISPAEPPDRPVWVHHGSSISHCGEADKPTSSWPVVAARQAGLEVVNLGFAGQCMLDPFVAEAIARTPADVISLKIGINIVGARAMDQRTFIPAVHGFLDRIRVGHPETPVVVASSILWPGHENSVGPMVPDESDGPMLLRPAGNPADVAGGALSLAVVREHLPHAVRVRAAAGEPIYYLDGRQLYGEADAATSPLPDGLHPDGPIYEEMGRRFAELVFGRDGVLAGALPLGRRRLAPTSSAPTVSPG